MSGRRSLDRKADVPATFDQVAAAYDRQVNLNPGYHANLGRAADALLNRLPATLTTPRLADVGCGTGASTRALALALWKRGLGIDLLGADGSAGMLAVAESKSWPDGVRFAQVQAEDVVHGLGAAGSHDGVLAAYLIRNVTDPDQVIADLVAAVRPGGSVAIHDYSVAGNPLAIAVWTFVCWTVVIPLGWLTSRHTALYRYLWRSALDFDSIPQLRARLHRAGLVDIEVVPARGWSRGIVHTLVGRRP